MCVSMCVCERKSQGERQRWREGLCAVFSVCTCVARAASVVVGANI